MIQQQLAPFGYYPYRHTMGLWIQKTWQLSFTLVVDDFTVNCVETENLHHLITALICSYKTTTGLGVTVYSGAAFKWYYQNCTCYISMPGYVTNVLNKLQHNQKKQPKHRLSKYVTPVYGAKTQYSTRYETPHLSVKQLINIKKITGLVLYYVRAIDPKTLVPLNVISTDQTKYTEKMQAAADHLMEYLATHPDATIRYHASEIILHIHSDAS